MVCRVFWFSFFAEPLFPEDPTAHYRTQVDCACGRSFEFRDEAHAYATALSSRDDLANGDGLGILKPEIFP